VPVPAPLAQIVTWNLLVTGVVRGLIYAVVAMGIVLVFRSSRVVNFAAGNIGVPATALFAVMTAKHGWPYWPALAGALLVGAATGAVVELAVIRRLVATPRVIVLVATIGVAQLMQAVTLALPDYRTGKFQTTFPMPFTGEWKPGLDITLRAGQVIVLITVPLVALALWWLLGHTTFGEAVRATSTNPDLARLTGISPKLVASAVWTLAGLLSAIGIMLTATETGSTTLIDIGPQTLLRALVAALIGGLTSFPLTVLGAVLVGVTDQVLTFNFTAETGLVQFVLFAFVLVLVARIGRHAQADAAGFQYAPRIRPVPERLARIWWVRRLPTLVAALALSAAVVLPLLSDRSARHLTWTTILAWALCAVSVIVLTGWAGQLSLGQMAFAGIGALTAAAFARGMEADIGWHSLRVIDGQLPSISFPWTMLLGAAGASLVATLVGLGALRVRGLLLAVSTIAFAIAAQAYLFNRRFFTGGSSTITIPRADLGPFALTHRNRAFYYFALAVLVVVLVVAGHLRRSGIGRTIVGVRENEAAAAAMTVSPARAKLTAFALGGFIAGLGGVILGAVQPSFSPTSRFFLVQDSLRIVSIAVIGGLGSLSGAVVGAVWVIGLPAFWPSNDMIPLFTSSIGLLLVLLYIPGGFTQIGYWARDTLLRWLEQRLPPEQVKRADASVPPPAVTRIGGRVPVPIGPDGTALAARDVRVAFGGLLAVAGVDFDARPGEVVGLIGTNGAGKSTLLNAIGGFVPATGTVLLGATDVSRMPPHKRARLGLGRTFQAATLYPELTVRDTVALALEARDRTSFWGTTLYLPPAERLERRRLTEAGELVDFLGLGRYADRFVAELSTGTRRIVELAAVLAVAPRVICLDEPTAGVAQREAEAFGPLIKRVQVELDATLVIVEHDMPLILSISDRVYCLEAGSVIASGRPDQIRVDPRVVASYLGTDERAIARSGAPTTVSASLVARRTHNG
jgi:ABC-type branched-subunit amino acid transport system ATPase component/ABC-type branched-subunit amino acid transport system permease subunit